MHVTMQQDGHKHGANLCTTFLRLCVAQGPLGGFGIKEAALEGRCCCRLCLCLRWLYDGGGCHVHTVLGFCSFLDCGRL